MQTAELKSKCFRAVVYSISKMEPTTGYSKHDLFEIWRRSGFEPNINITEDLFSKCICHMSDVLIFWDTISGLWYAFEDPPVHISLYVNNDFEKISDENQLIVSMVQTAIEHGIKDFGQSLSSEEICNIVSPRIRDCVKHEFDSKVVPTVLQAFQEKIDNVTEKHVETMMSNFKNVLEELDDRMKRCEVMVDESSIEKLIFSVLKKKFEQEG